jgi:hypothetical protein
MNDLTVDTKQYKFTSCYGFDDIDIFLFHKTGRVPQAISDYYLTRQEVYELIDYLKEINYEKNDWLIDRLSNMVMLMEGKEKARFHFW